MTDISPSSLDRRRVLFSGAAMLGAGSLAGGLAACAPKAKVRQTLRVATYKGESDYRLLFKAAGVAPDGYDLVYSEFAGGNLILEALSTGSLDVGGMSEIPPVFAAGTANPTFRQIAVSHGDVNSQVVLVPKGSKIATLADLKGKRIGYVRATTSQYFLIRMLNSVGLSWKDITPVSLSVSDGATAFSTGSLDAWAIYGYPIQRAVATEGARVLKTALGFLSGNYLISAYTGALDDPAKVALIRDYLGLVRRAYAWSAAHPDEWAAIVATAINVPLDYVKDAFHRRSDPYSLRPVSEAAIASQQQVADIFFKEGGLLSKPVDVRPLWDNRFNDLLSQGA